MVQPFAIPGLGELQPDNTAQTSLTVVSPEKPTSTPNVKASTDTEMTGGDDGPVVQEAGQGAPKVEAVTNGSESRQLELTTAQQENDVSAKSQEDEKMEDQDLPNTAAAASHSKSIALPETREVEATGSAGEAQPQPVQLGKESAPASPRVTDALEAALDGLLGPITKSEVEDRDNGGEEGEKEGKKDAKPAAETHTNGQAKRIETAPDQGGAGEADADANPEWEVDSSPYESSSSDDSSDSDSDSDGDESKLLGVEETARLLMAADGGSDDEMDGVRAAKQAAGVRTKNELPDEPEPTPQICLSPDDIIAPLGTVQHIVEGTQTVIEALRVGSAVTILDRGSVLCKEDRTVLGVIHDTIATVHKPMYILKFRSEEEANAAALERGAQIWYSKSHANFVFPSQLRQEKGSDASNLHDEEVGPDEMEYSDDEQEQAHKREKKNRKRGGKGKPNKGDERGSRAPSTVGDSHLNYGEDDEGVYNKLPRPSNFGMGLPPPPPPGVSAFPTVNGGNRGGQHGGRRGESRGRGRGRGSQGRGRGGGQGYGSRPPNLPHPQPPNPHQPPPPFPVIPAPPPGQWPFPVPPMPQFGGASGSPTTPVAPAPSYPMPNWNPAQPSPFPFPPVPPPNWSQPQQLRPPQHTNYMPPAGGYSVPGQYSPSNGQNPPAPAQNYQYPPNYYGGQVQNNQQQRWG